MSLRMQFLEKPGGDIEHRHIVLMAAVRSSLFDTVSSQDVLMCAREFSVNSDMVLDQCRADKIRCGGMGQRL